MNNYSTINDVAKSLGISTTTVWRAINNKEDVSEKTKKKVLQKVKELNYHPSIAATSLHSNKTNLIGFISPFAYQNFDEVLVRINNKLFEKGYNLVLALSGNYVEKEIELVNQMIQRRVDALLLFRAGWLGDIKPGNEYDHLFRLQEMGIVTVAATTMGTDKISSFVCDEKLAAYLLTDHFIKKGKKRIGFLHWDFREYLSDEAFRFEGYKEALRNYGLKVDEKLVSCVALDYDLDEVDEDKLYNYYMKNKPDAIVCAGSNQAIKYMNVLRKFGIKCPEDIGLAGVDYGVSNTLCYPSLTYADTRVPDRIEGAINYIFDVMEKREEGIKITETPKKYIFKPKLIIGESS